MSEVTDLFTTSFGSRACARKGNDNGERARTDVAPLDRPWTQIQADRYAEGSLRCLRTYAGLEVISRGDQALLSRTCGTGGPAFDVGEVSGLFTTADSKKARRRQGYGG
jgi:hypothetical protein